MSFLSFNHVSKKYEGTSTEALYAVNDANIEIEQGELVVFVGPSGCGKSTILRMIAGLEDISSGDIHLDGKIINDFEVDQRDIAMVFQDYALYPHMSVKENIIFGLKNQKTDKEIISEKLKESSKLLELNHYLDRLPKNLSGGQRQRVALARALVKEPKVFLLDEPLSNLDAKLRVQTRKMIASLHEKLKATMIYVTHDQVEAMTLGNKIVVMNKGEIQQVDRPEEIYLKPKNIFVASFIGTPSMNLFKVILQDDFTTNIGHTTIDLEDYKDALKEYLGKEVILGIRPEDIELENVASTQGIKANHVEFLGSENLLYFSSEQGDFIVKLQESRKLDKESIYNVSFKADKLHFFDLQNEQRINN
ncbi:carbohydrate ABC transporter ATP-binding protein, CUT1 family [Ignavigranum ruoffiae]|uniref:Carbohydrate ABC transporter ATP-binding protein, CUT1 family n=1 Tax=Ignavigranum ruoffiae TaxID=89093 RepID=A0A1H9GM41_9LACT|nr:ABC transporter ATP-binding protein [Ignavigranum ruoffiae]SEQ51155.1 carbohydrate ABC transporter ATP-binding protein, CUT1 family [Ignavigranum ruoffiae]